jgi:predicted aldo/keto reductase-like oxidoreductase
MLRENLNRIIDEYGIEFVIANGENSAGGVGITKGIYDELLSYGIDNGINIIDTGYSFHATDLKGKGNCEPVIGNFLENGYREKVLLSAKLPSWLIKE